MPPQQIRERINAPWAGRAAIATADPTREYISGGETSPYLSAYYQTLPTWIEDIESSAGDDVWDRMLRDPQVFSDIQILKQAVLSQNLVLNPPVPDTDPAYAKAEEICDFCRRCLDRIAYFHTRTLYELLDALVYGHKLGEMVYEVGSGEDAGRLVPKAVKVKARDSYGIVVDTFNNLIGILAIIPGSSMSLLGSIYGNPALEPNFVPRSKIVLLSVLGRDSSPAGRSWLRPAYEWWWLKQQCQPEYFKYLTQFAAPSLIGTTPPNALPTPLLDAQGNPQVDADGNPVYVNPEANMLSVLTQYRNATAIVLPSGSEVKTLFAYNDGSAFRAAIDLCDRQITRGILFQELATMEAQHQSRAAAQTHQDILDTVINHLRTVVEETIERDMLGRWVELNYGVEARAFTPRAELGDTSETDFAKKAMAYAALYKAGYLDPSQLPECDARIGVPKRSPEEIRARTDAAQAKADLQKAGAAGLLQAQAGQQQGGQQQGAGDGNQQQDQQQQAGKEEGGNG